MNNEDIDKPIGEINLLVNGLKERIRSLESRLAKAQVKDGMDALKYDALQMKYTELQLSYDRLKEQHDQDEHAKSITANLAKFFDDDRGVDSAPKGLDRTEHQDWITAARRIDDAIHRIAWIEHIIYSGVRHAYTNLYKTGTTPKEDL